MGGADTEARHANNTGTRIVSISGHVKTPAIRSRGGQSTIGETLL